MSKEIQPGIWYINGIPHPNLKSPNEILIRQRAYNAWHNRHPDKNLVKPLKELVQVRCVNPECPLDIIYQAIDLSPLISNTKLPFIGKNGIGPIIGPCVVCGQHTTEVVRNEK